MAAAVNAALYSLSSSSSDVQEFDTKHVQNTEDITSPAKRIKQNSPVVSRPTNKEIHLCECCQSPLKSFTALDLTNKEKICDDCYGEVISGRDTTNSDVTSQDSEGAIPSSHTGSGDLKDEEPPELHSSKNYINSGIKDSEQHRRTPEAIINYSPESVFLRRLKESSRAVGDLVAPGKIRRPLAKPSCVISPKKLQTNPMKSAEPNRDKFSPLRSPHSVRHSFGHGHELISNENQQCTTDHPPHHSPRHTYNDELELKKNRKHVSNKEHCHCCVEQNVRSRKKFSTGTKEKAAKLVGKVRL